MKKSQMKTSGRSAPTPRALPSESENGAMRCTTPAHKGTDIANAVAGLDGRLMKE